MSQKENIKIKIKKSGDNYKVINNPQKGEDLNKGNKRYNSWFGCHCIYCNVIDEDKIILAAQFALKQEKKEFTTKISKYSAK